MKVVIVYPVPLDTPEVRDLFKPFVERFTRTLRELDPGCEYELMVVLNGGDVDDQAEAMALFYDLPVKFTHYTGNGCDFGSFQHYAKDCQPCFMVCCVTRVYFHRDGWLKRLVDIRKLVGPGLYATSVSREGGKLHACTRCYAMDSEIFKQYPHQITSRDQGVFFEVGDGCLLDWFVSNRHPAVVVYWHGGASIIDLPGALCQSIENIFRKGDQSNLLVRDKHTDAWANADEAEKKRLATLCYG